MRNRPYPDEGRESRHLVSVVFLGHLGGGLHGVLIRNKTVRAKHVEAFESGFVDLSAGQNAVHAQNVDESDITSL